MTQKTWYIYSRQIQTAYCDFSAICTYTLSWCLCLPFNPFVPKFVILIEPLNLLSPFCLWREERQPNTPRAHCIYGRRRFYGCGQYSRAICPQCWTVVSSRQTQTSPIQRRTAQVSSISVLRRIVSIEHGRSIVRECYTKPRTYTILGSDVLQSYRQTLLTNLPEKNRLALRDLLAWIACRRFCLVHTLSTTIGS